MGGDVTELVVGVDIKCVVTSGMLRLWLGGTVGRMADQVEHCRRETMP